MEFTPRQLNFLSYYLDPKSETFSEVKASAIKAGFTESYARELTSEKLKWFEEGRKRQMKMLEKAEQNLDNALDYSDDDSEKLKHKIDVSKFVAKTLGKNKGYSERNEITGKDGQDLLPRPILGGQTNVSTNNSDQKDITADQEDKSNSRGDECQQDS